MGGHLLLLYATAVATATDGGNPAKVMKRMSTPKCEKSVGHRGSGGAYSAPPQTPLAGRDGGFAAPTQERDPRFRPSGHQAQPYGPRPAVPTF